ncbi:hypothetical protein ACWGPZ_27980 [Priestia megaterium]
MRHTIYNAAATDPHYFIAMFNNMLKIRGAGIEDQAAILADFSY